MTNWNLIVSDSELRKARGLRSKPVVQKKERTVALQELQEEGWELVKTYKDPKYVSVQRAKTFDVWFEDRVWTLFHDLGFTHMNQDANFKMACDFHNPDHTQQIDVFAADEETVIIVECKSAEKLKSAGFKKEIEAYIGQMACLRVEAQKQFPGRKVKFIWATENINLAKTSEKTLRDNGIALFNENTISYYTELVKHIGLCARYQLLGNLFASVEIKNMDNKVLAIKGKMGNHVYYSFSIEPSRLLKIGYVLHRNEANSSMMPTYQRLIKKKRLNEIRDFIDHGGYFPNSLIVSIDNGGRGDLKFEAASTKGIDTQSKIGTLYLPKKYRSAYIIDGQHRLYGYADSKYKETDVVPVIAFVDLDQSEQVKLFMDINEKQKAVPKVLRATLDADVLWVSKDKNKQRKAMQSRIAQTLGDITSSPLFGRIVTGENEASTTRCITVTQIQAALSRCSFFSEYAAGNVLKRNGTFDMGKIEDTCKNFQPFIEGCFEYIKTKATTEWEKGKTGNLTTNRGIYALIRVCDDIINYLVAENKVNPLVDSTEKILAEVEYYLEPLAEWLSDMPTEDRAELVGIYGGGADGKYWRFFQKVIHDKCPEFNPDGLEKYIKDKEKAYNAESFDMLHDIELYVRQLVISKLTEQFTNPKEKIPKDIYKRVLLEAVDQGMDPNQALDLVTLEDCRAIVTYSNNWSGLFEKLLAKPNEKGDKDVRTAWMKQLHDLGKKNSNQYAVSQEEYELLKELHSWLGLTEA